MANSRDPRRPTRFHRGSKRYGDVGGHSPPGDDLENTRDHERIWFELRKTRGCCGCDHPGLKYCFETADYPTLVCEGFYPPAFTLIDYYPGYQGDISTGMNLMGGCGSPDQVIPEGFAVFTEFETDGSWRNGPIFGKRGFGGNGVFQGTSAGWPDHLWMDQSHSFEYFIKPSSTDIGLARNLTASGPFMNLGDGGYFTSFAAGGGITASHILDSATSALGVIVADQWHHIVYVRNVPDKSLSIWVNGRRVVRIRIPISNINGGTEYTLNPDTLFSMSLGEGSWVSDVSRYAGPMPASEIRRRARVMLGIVGLPEGEDDPSNPDDGGVIIEDPTFLIDNLDPSQISSGGVAGNVMMSDTESAYWETPEDSPFELEVRKGVANGYAELDATTKVPTSRLATGVASALSFLRGDRTWKVGELLPGPPTALRQMLRGDPAPSTEYLAALPTFFTSTPTHYRLTQASSPYTPDAASWQGNLVASGGAVTVNDPDFCFPGETVVELPGGTAQLAGSMGAPNTDAGRMWVMMWVKLLSLPAAPANLLRFGAVYELDVLTDGKLRFQWNGAVSTPMATTSAPLPLDEWAHVIFANDGAGGGTGCVCYINGVQVGSGPGNFGSAFLQLILGGDGIDCRIAHLSISGVEWVTRLTNPSALAQYQLRRPVWTIVPEVKGGVDVAENGVVETAERRNELDFVAGANVTVTVTDDDPNEKAVVTIAASPPAGSGFDASENDTPVTASPRGRYNFLDGFGTYWDLTDDGPNDEVEIVVNLPDASGASVGDVLTLDGSMEPAWEFPGGGGGGGWDAKLNLPLTVTTDWVMPAGWSNDGTKHIVGVNTPQTRNKYNPRVPQGGAVYEVQIQLPNSSRSAADQRAGILVNWDGTNTAAALYMLKWNAKASGQVTVERDAIAAGTAITVAGGLAVDTWHTLRVVRMGVVADIYVNGVYQMTQRIDAHAGAQFEHSFIALYGYQIDAWFRNLKVWTLAQP